MGCYSPSSAIEVVFTLDGVFTHLDFVDPSTLKEKVSTMILAMSPQKSMI